jgi:hypothetical protein
LANLSREWHKFELYNEWEIRYLEKCVNHMKQVDNGNYVENKVNSVQEV